MMYDDVAVTLGTESPFGDPNPVESPSVVGPLFPGDTLVTVTDIDPNMATDVAVYANGVEAATATGPFPSGETTLTVSELSDGDVVTATQTIATVESCYSRSVVVGVPAPTISGALVQGFTTVKVGNIEEGLASAVTVYEDLSGDLELLGSTDNPTTDPAEVTVPALSADMVIVATQTIAGVESAPSPGMVVEAEPPAIVEWIETSELPYGLTDHSLVYLNGYLYSLGGRTGSGSGNPTCQANDFVFYAPVNLDGSLGEWQETTPMPVPLACFGAAGYSDRDYDRIYVWGGWTQGWPTMNTCFYADQDPNDGTLGPWTTSAVTIPDNVDVTPPGTQMDAFGRGDMIYNGKLYIVNGEWDNGDSFGNTNNCYYSPITPGGDFGEWVLTTPTDTSNGSWFHGVAVIEGTTETYMYRVAGNYRGTTEWDMYRTTVDPNDGSLGPWVEEPEHLPSARYEIACASADNKWIFAICGLYGATTQNTVYYTEVDPNTGGFLGWREGPDYPETVSRNTAISYSIGGHTYVLVAGGGPYGGYDGGRTPKCYYAQIYEDICYGDLDGDREVGLADLQILLAHYGMMSGAVYEDGDLNGDGAVGLADLQGLLSVYGTSCP
jgi:hypothetical protein